MNATARRRTTLAAGLLAASLGLVAITAAPASAAVTTGQHSVSETAHSTSVPAPPTTVPTHVGDRAGQHNAVSTSASNGVISGISLTVTNTTNSAIAVTFMFDGPSGGQANWQWLNPGQSVTQSNATTSGPDIWNSFLFFPKDNKQVKFESKLAAWSCATTITVDGVETTLDRGQQGTGSVNGHSFTTSRAQSDIVLPMVDWIDGHETSRPNMGLTITS
ncbi:MAG: hypothetical protein WCI74_00485 [Actinomycetes bacterium]